eukprot:CAMPEP_0184740148 /NCGR_PEP_ID=MMETSP0315-20130426/3149_1 /TAXON_ID=101924 /ORGANISM="Rhodosorus marinus, Strain UTEX LB 2760" /LENGTH=628 /DNA_ID=CAMNT_0027209625 /DNA_START=121 /DNA_END=2007 /DNA_ORIENTATION=-
MIAGFLNSSVVDGQARQHKTHSCMRKVPSKPASTQSCRRRSQVVMLAGSEAVALEPDGLAPGEAETDEPKRPRAWKNVLLGLCFGFIAGMMGALAGLGGGVILIPLMTGVLGISQHVAHGTSLVAVAFTASIGAASYAMKGGIVRVSTALLISTLAVVTAKISSQFAQAVKSEKLKWYFAQYLVFASLLLLVQPLFQQLQLFGGLQMEGMDLKVQNGFITTLLGLVTGTVTGLVGVGGGTIMVPGMTILLGFAQKTAQGTALLASIAPSIVSATTYIASGNVVPSLLYGILPGVSVGSLFGANIAVRSQDGFLRLFCASLLLLSGLRTLFSTKRPVQTAEEEDDNEILKPSKKVPEEGFLTSSRCKLHYKYLNQDVKGKNPLVLLHMVPRSMDEFKEFLEEMANNRSWKRPVILFDLPGYGASERFKDIPMKHVADEILTGLRSLGIRTKVDVFGHLLGAHVAMSMASRKPRRVRRLALADPIYLTPESRELVAAWEKGMPKPQVDENGEFFVNVWNKRSQFVPPDINYRCVMDELRAADTGHSSSFSVSKTPMEDILPKVKAPSLVLWSSGVVGMFDSFGWKIGENRALVERGLPTVDVLEIADANIDGLCTHTSAYSDPVLEYLQS